MINKQQVELAARELCKMRDKDPDAKSQTSINNNKANGSAWIENWILAREEIMIGLTIQQVQQAIDKVTDEEDLSEKDKEAVELEVKEEKS